MIQKKDTQNIHEKVVKKTKGKRKTTKNLLTSMTTHMKKDGGQEQEPEEEAEDGEPELSQVEEEDVTKSKFKVGRRDSAMSDQAMMEKK